MSSEEDESFDDESQTISPRKSQGEGKPVYFA